MTKLHIKKGDTVYVNAGEDKGKTGRVLEVDVQKRRAIVEGVNFVSRHTKPNAKSPQGGILKKEAPVHISNLNPLDPKSGKPTRIGRVRNEKGKLVRISKKSGDIKSPIMVGGGRAFGPQPRDYSFKLNKKVKSLARKSALTYKMRDNAIVVVEDFQFEKAKTRDFVSIMQNLHLPEKKVVFVLSEANKNVYLSARNLPKVQVVIFSELDTYKILDAKTLVLMEGSLAGIEQTFNA
jgi:50S ribosomal protein L4/ribosomal protein L24